MAKRKKRVVEVPAHDYEPTRAEMDDEVSVGDQGMTFEDWVRQFLRTPVEVREVSAAEWRSRRRKEEADES